MRSAVAGATFMNEFAPYTMQAIVKDALVKGLLNFKFKIISLVTLPGCQHHEMTNDD